MKQRIFPLSFVVGLAMTGLLPLALTAQEPSVTVTTPPASVTVQAPPPAVDTAKLPYGLSDVAKLSKAQISEDVIVTYIQNSGTAYNLGPNEILYLRDQGVSDRVINVMLDQRRRVAESLAQTPPAAPSYPQAAPEQAQPAQPGGYAQTAPNAPPSSVYTIPYDTSAYGYPYYSSYYPYSYPYYGGYWPYFSVGFYPGCYYGHGYYGHGYYGHGGIHVTHGGGGGIHVSSGGGGMHGGGGGGHGGHH